eukprot:gb/GEZJ01007422.1/.p1 GENE.gb/GEZJ01007422.1/~~gb/GEZJ01007422.1/.p1  ORF type:complete len:102 (+),score=9.53 gb/GEZJ01007422.1/:286-591(+)
MRPPSIQSEDFFNTRKKCGKLMPNSSPSRHLKHRASAPATEGSKNLRICINFLSSELSDGKNTWRHICDRFALVFLKGSLHSTCSTKFFQLPGVYTQIWRE